MKGEVLQLISKSLDEVALYAQRQDIAAYENVPNFPFCLEDIRSLKHSLRNPSEMQIKLWNSYLLGLQKRSEKSGSTETIDISYLLSCLEKYRASGLQQN